MAADRLVFALMGCLLGSAVFGQGAPAPTGLDQSPNWTLDTTPKPPSGKKHALRPSGAEAEKAARLDAARRNFFESQGEEAKPKAPTEFGGYDADTMSGTMHPGAGFKF